MRNNQLGAIKYTFQIDINHRIKLSFGHLNQARILSNACVINQDINASMLLHHLVNYRLNAGAISHIHGIAFGIQDLCCSAVDSFLVDIGNDDLGTLLRKTLGSSKTNTLSGTGDDGYFVF